MSINLVKVESAYEPIVANKMGAYLSIYSMERLGVFLLHPGWDASPSQGYPQHGGEHGGERHCESKVSCPRTQHNVPGEPGPLAQELSATMRPPRLVRINLVDSSYS